MDTLKPWWQSKTLWFHIGSGLVIVATEAAALVDLVPEDWRDIIRTVLILGQVVGGIILRLVTVKGIG